MKRYHIKDPLGGFYAFDIYGESKQDALNNYRTQWYPDRKRLPRGMAIWEAY